MNADSRNAYLYDAEGRICAVNPGIYGGGMTGYQYEAGGNRIAKGFITSMSCDITQNGFQRTEGFVVGPSGEQLTEVGANNTTWNHTNIYAGGKLIGTYDAAGLHFHIDDPLGTRRVQVSSTGTLEATYQSLPFGDGYNATAFVSNPDPTENHFTGKERDIESGNDFFGARYYNSATGRWLSPDPKIPNRSHLVNPQKWNKYAYALNMPLSLVDPDGQDPVSSQLLLRTANYSNEVDNRISAWGDAYRAGKSMPGMPTGNIKHLYDLADQMSKNGGGSSDAALPDSRAIREAAEAQVSSEIRSDWAKWISSPTTTTDDLKAAKISLDGAKSSGDIPDWITTWVPGTDFLAKSQSLAKFAGSEAQLFYGIDSDIDQQEEHKAEDGKKHQDKNEKDKKDQDKQ